MKKLSVWGLCLIGICGVVSCSDECVPVSSGQDDGVMKLTAQVVLSRATSDNVWDGDGSESVSVSDGEKTATYHVVNAAGDLQPADAGNLLYWASATEAQTVTAWYPATDDNQPYEEWTVKADQSGDGYQLSDYMYTRAEVSLQGNHNLPFRHQTAKVEIHLKGDGTTDAVLADADVKIKNVVLSGTVQDGALAAKTEEDAVNVTPKSIVTAAGYLSSYEALLIPQKVEGKVFIEIATSGDTYTYIPEGDDALLEGASRYVYYVTVGKPGISVEIEKGNMSWGQEGTDIAVDMQE